ncbi:MAG: hypothetical protein AABY61_15445 [Nitrospirota bacterium]
MLLDYGFSIGLPVSSAPVELKVLCSCQGAVQFNQWLDLVAEEKKEMSALNNPVVAVIVSLIISVGYFVFVDHYLMDMQGLDFWYLFRN